jgi:hypothetical protein
LAGFSILANDVAIGISFVSGGRDIKVFLRRGYDIIEERIGDILAANIRASQERLSRPQRQQASIWPETTLPIRRDRTLAISTRKNAKVRGLCG